MVERIFISSTSGALAPYRQAAVDLCHKAQLIPIHMEQFFPDQLAPLDVCLRELDGCDAVLLLVGHRYGASPPGESLSFTELEYRHAVDRGLPVYPWIVDPGFEWPADDREPDPAIRAALNQFVALVASTQTRRLLRDLSQFREELALLLGSLRRPSRDPSASFALGRRPCADPHALAEAMADDWENARRQLAGPARERELLTNWVSRQNPGDYPVDTIRTPVADESGADERILGFIAHFAPDARPFFDGGPADGSGLAAACARAAAGDAAAAAWLDRLTEPMLYALAQHYCRDEHPQCGESGCVVLGQAFAARAEIVATLNAAATEFDHVQHLVDSTITESPLRLPGQLARDPFGSPRFAGRRTETRTAKRSVKVLTPVLLAALRYRAFQAFLDPAVRSRLTAKRAGLPDVPRPTWWADLRQRADAATDPVRIVLDELLVELADAAAYLESVAAANAVKAQAQARFDAAMATELPRTVRRAVTGAIPAGLAMVSVGVPIVGLLGAIVAVIFRSGAVRAGAGAAMWWFGGSITVTLIALGLFIWAMFNGPLWLAVAVSTVSALANAYWLLEYPRFVYLNWTWTGYGLWAIVLGYLLVGSITVLVEWVPERATEVAVRASREVGEPSPVQPLPMIGRSR